MPLPESYLHSGTEEEGTELVMDHKYAGQLVLDLIMSNEPLSTYVHEQAIEQAYPGLPRIEAETQFQVDSEEAGETEPVGYTMYYMWGSIFWSKLLAEAIQHLSGPYDEDPNN